MLRKQRVGVSMQFWEPLVLLCLLTSSDDRLTNNANYNHVAPTVCFYCCIHPLSTIFISLIVPLAILSPLLLCNLLILTVLHPKLVNFFFFWFLFWRRTRIKLILCSVWNSQSGKRNRFTIFPWGENVKSKSKCENTSQNSH